MTVYQAGYQIRYPRLVGEHRGGHGRLRRCAPVWQDLPKRSSCASTRARNPFLALERAKKREALVSSTHAGLQEIAEATTRDRRPLRGKDKIARRGAKVIDHFEVAKHSLIEIEEDSCKALVKAPLSLLIAALARRQHRLGDSPA